MCEFLLLYLLFFKTMVDQSCNIQTLQGNNNVYILFAPQWKTAKYKELDPKRETEINYCIIILKNLCLAVLKSARLISV